MKKKLLSHLLTILIISVLTEALSFQVWAEGGSHTSSGGDLVINPTTDDDINEFIFSTNEWSKLVSLQNSILMNAQFLLLSGAYDTPENFYLKALSANEESSSLDQDFIIKNLSLISQKQISKKLSSLFSMPASTNKLQLAIQPKSTKCESNNEERAAAIYFDNEKNTYFLCLDYAKIKDASDKETFQLHLMSLLTHELVHLWNDDILKENHLDSPENREILPDYFQQLALLYFSHSHHPKARNLISKTYNWVSAIYQSLSAMRIVWESEINYEIGRLPVSQQLHPSAETMKAILAINERQTRNFCNGPLRDSVFPSEWLTNLNQIQSMFLDAGLIELEMPIFARLTYIFHQITLLKYQCYLNEKPTSQFAPTPLNQFFKSLGHRSPISQEQIDELDNMLAKTYPSLSYLPNHIIEPSVKMAPKDFNSFFIKIQSLTIELERIYRTQETNAFLK